MSVNSYRTVDWQKVLQECSCWKHKKRRNFIKKIKRSCKRKSLILNQNKDGLKNNDRVVTSSCITPNVNQLSSFGSVYDFVAREVAQAVVKRLLSLVSNDFYEVDKIQPSRLDFMQHVHKNSTPDDSLATTNESLSINDANKASPINNLNTNDESDDILKVKETERFLEELDEEVKKWHNPFLPDAHSTDIIKSNDISSQPVSSYRNSNHRENKSVVSTPLVKSKELCRFYEKVGACRFGDNCSRYHEKVDSSKTLLLQGMFSTFAFDIMERAQKTEQGDADDIWLEHSDADLYDEFVEFYNDVTPELESYGKIRQFKVCCNRDKHLLGNVYVQYKHESNAVKAANHLNGRFYAGKHLSVKFISIKSWKSAICGLHYNNRNCPRGHHCNFLHVFKEPSRRFYDADIDKVTCHTSSASFNRKRRNKSKATFDRYEKHRRYSSNEDSSCRRHHRYSEDHKKKHKHKKSHKKHSKKHKHENKKKS